MKHPLIVALALSASSWTQADLVWTGTSDAASLYDEGNWLDNGGSIPPADTINPGTAVTAATGGTIRIDSGAGTPSGFTGNLDIGVGNDLIVSGGKTLASTTGSGLRVDGTSTANTQNLTLDNGTGRFQFILSFSAVLSNGASLRLDGGGNPVNSSTINVLDTGSVLLFNDETLAAFQSEHQNKVTFNAMPLVFGTDPLVQEPGDNAVASAFNGANGVQINFVSAIPEPHTMGLILIGTALLTLRRPQS